MGLEALLRRARVGLVPSPNLEEIELPSNNFIPKQGRYQTVLPSTSLSIGVCVYLQEVAYKYLEFYLFKRIKNIWAWKKPCSPAQT